MANPREGRAMHRSWRADNFPVSQLLGIYNVCKEDRLKRPPQTSTGFLAAQTTHMSFQTRTKRKVITYIRGSNVDM